MKNERAALALTVAITALIAGGVLYYVLTTGGSIQSTTPTTTTGVAEPGTTVKVLDFANRTVEVKTPVKRIVAIGPGALRLIVYLNATELLVGVEEVEKTWSPVGRDYAMAYGDVLKALPVIGKGGPGNPPDPEAIASVRPDLIVMSAYYTTLKDPDELSRATGAAVIVVDYSPVTSTNLSMFYRALRLLGEVLGRSDRAEALVNYTESLLKDLRSRTTGLNTTSIRVYVGAVSYRGGQPFTGTQVPYPPLSWLGMASIADTMATTRGFLNVDFDSILMAQPDVVFVDEGNLNIVVQDFSKDPGKYCALRAFTGGRVYGLLPFNYYHSNIATALANSYYIGKVLFPERFTDVDPASKADEIYSVFLGKQVYSVFLQKYPGYINLSSIFQCK
ncbi:ABC transporter substrate-binding protein [Desulfurococcus mucosus]|uniref:Periplasmic binding protein n=1 Tax=Desulfurococcus mucosus (strain ATCC 35584 / DSM 2162 / JCM 9187 / O7/1) TaxID=765177 RepID=E8R8Y8_DESM0|nr:ABC transporter substrate-binding protein [Desulfurococcus mucosus]ADV64964.1 periplasmic binding protein [Desulfurococcus mucosus DSM 2162]